MTDTNRVSMTHEELKELLHFACRKERLYVMDYLANISETMNDEKFLSDKTDEEKAAANLIAEGIASACLTLMEKLPILKLEVRNREDKNCYCPLCTLMKKSQIETSH